MLTINKSFHLNNCNLLINKNYDDKDTSLALIEKYVNFIQ